MPKIDFWSIKKTKWKTFISFTARLVNKWSWVSTMTYLGSKLGHSSGEIGKIRPFLTLDSLCKYENQTWALIKETWCKKDRFTIFPIYQFSRFLRIVRVGDVIQLYCWTGGSSSGRFRNDLSGIINVKTFIREKGCFPRD